MAAVGMSVRGKMALSLKCLFGRGLLASSPSIVIVQKASITSKVTREINNIKRPPPHPYKTKGLGQIARIFDNMLKRFDDNTKVVVVEGNIGAGKSAFAKELADLLDMQYYPEASLDSLFINPYGNDVRDYKHLIPEGSRPFDVKDFYEKPNHRSVARFQLLMYRERYGQYIDALTHLMNTGQGVVLERCAYSDFVFLEAMFKKGYVSRQARSLYYEFRENTIVQLMRPHLVIYLDAPVDVLLERIKKRGIEHEVNSEVLTKDYLETLEEVYKYKYLKDIGKHAELMIYDWSNFGDVEVVVEDIERLDIDNYDEYDTKMSDWRLNKQEFVDQRYSYTCDKDRLLNYFNVPVHDCPEMMMESDDMTIYWNVYNQVPGNKYAYGYNSKMGDKNVFTKDKSERYYPV